MKSRSEKGPQTNVLTLSFLFFFFKAAIGWGWDLIVLGTLESSFKCFSVLVVLAATMAIGGKACDGCFGGCDLGTIGEVSI